MTRRLFWAAWTGLFIIAGCSSGPRQDEREFDRSIEQSMRLGGFSARAGEHDRAARAYELALDRAMLRDDPGAMFRSAYALAATYARLGRWESYERTLRLARDAAPELGDPRRIDLEILAARAELRRGRPEEAGAIAARVPPTATARQRNALAATKGMVAAEIGDSRTLAEALEILEKAPESDRSASDLLELRAAVARLAGDHASAAKTLELKADAHRGRRDYPAMAEALARAAISWSAAGDPGQAADRHLRAARSYARQGEHDKSIEQFNSSIDAAEAARDSDAIARAKAEMVILEESSAAE